MGIKEIFSSIINKFDRENEYKFKYFEVHLVEHCNLNCQSCFHFAPLAEEEYANLELFEKDFKRLSELAGSKIESFLLMGGEPLLHPQLTSFFEVSRRYFPNADIQLVTNGILLPVQGDDFWHAMKEYNIILRPTKYPIDVDYDKVEQKAKEYNIRVHYFNNINVSQKIPISKQKIKSSDDNYKKCSFKTFYNLNKGKVYPCCISGNINHFIKYFNFNIKNPEKNGIDIYKVKSIYEIDRFLKKKIPLCKYCNGSKLHFYRPWQKSKKDIKEWT